MSELPKSWAAIPLSDVVINITITDKKIPQKEYLSEGVYPVFDQGQDYIGGYSDKKEKLVNCELPVLVFGDHTRVVKFVNQPFAPGADGIKVLQPQHFYNPRLLEYFTRHIATHLTNHGYARHYQHLVKSIIPLPPINEQHRIVAKIEELFSELDKGIENLKTAQAQLKVYRQALLKHAFEGKLTAQWRAEHHTKQSVAPAQAGAQPLNDMDSRLPPAFARVTGNDKPLESADTLLKRIQQERAQRYQQQLADWEASGKQGSKPKPPKTLPPLSAEELAELPELPEGWGWVTLTHIQSHDKYAVKAGPFGSALKKEFYVQDGYKIYGQEQVIRSDHEYGDYFVDERKFDELASCAVKPFDVLISLVGTIGKVLVLPETAKLGIINPRLVKISLNLQCYRAKFFKAYFESGFLRSLYANESQGTTMDILNLGIIQRLPYPLCSVTEQDMILEILEEKFSEIDQLDQTITTSLQQAEALRQSILKKAFSGQLVPQDPNDEPASELLARIKAERLASQGNLVVRRKGGRS